MTLAGLKDEAVETLKIGAAVLAIYVVFTTAAFGQFHIPSESMRPSLMVGDRIIASKFSYGWSKHSLPLKLGEALPFEGKLFGRTPERGDVVIFRHPQSRDIFIKRVIGVPGDRIALDQGQVILNGVALSQRELQTVQVRDERGRSGQAVLMRERLPGGPDYLIYDFGRSAADNQRPIQAPAGYVFVMGDNRDNSVDSRAWGLVPLENVVGRAEIVIYTLAPFHASKADPDLPNRLWRSL